MNVLPIPCSLPLRNRIFGLLPILYIAGSKGRKMNKFISDRKNVTIIVFDKPINEKCARNISTENIVFYHPLYLIIKCLL